MNYILDDYIPSENYLDLFLMMENGLHIRPCK